MIAGVIVVVVFVVVYTRSVLIPNRLNIRSFRVTTAGICRSLACPWEISVRREHGRMHAVEMSASICTGVA